MDRTAASEIALFRRQIDALRADSQNFEVQDIASDAMILRPQTQMSDTARLHLEGLGKAAALTLGALVHGNEWGSLWVINEILEKIAKKELPLTFPLGLFLGNPEAALKNERFLDCDLNRSFPKDAFPSKKVLLKLKEEKRAHEIAPLLEKTLFFMDFHQTIQKTTTGFFIFGYRRSALQWARLIDPLVPVVTHWGGGFSQNGLCSDEYVNTCSGLGITLELGAISPVFEPHQYELGLHCALTAMEKMALYLRLPPRPLEVNMASFSPSPTETEQGGLYTWGHIEPWPIGQRVELVPGLINFVDIQKGDLFATVEGQPVFAPLSGKVLFPKYLSYEKQKELTLSGQLPREIIRILRPLSPRDLPNGPE